MKFLGFEAQDFTVTADKYYAYDYDYFNMKTHSHRNAEIMYAESGVSEVYILSAAGTVEKLMLKKRQFIVIASKTPHRLLVKKSTRCKILNLELNAEPARGINFGAILHSSQSLQKIFSSDLPFYLLTDYTDIGDIIHKIHSELTAKVHKTDSDLEIQALILQLLIAVSRSSLNAESTSSAYVKRALEFIYSEFKNAPSATDVANSVGLNSIYLEKQVKTHTGKTILNHLTTLKISYAKRLLENTDLALADIAAECGFGSRQSFYEAFKKSEKLSPNQYRQESTLLSAKNYKQNAFEWE